MPLPSLPAARVLSIPGMLVAAALAACASPAAPPARTGGPATAGNAGGATPIVAPVGTSAEAFDRGDAVNLPRGRNVRCGWVELRRNARGIRSLTLASPGTPVGEALRAGKPVAADTKVIEQEAVPDLLEAFERQGFGRFAVSVEPNAGPSNALGAVWLEVDGRVQTLFLIPGAVKDPRTKDLPRVYEGVKALVLTIHQATPGFTVTTGSGWSDDSSFGRQPPGR